MVGIASVFLFVRMGMGRREEVKKEAILQIANDAERFHSASLSDEIRALRAIAKLEEPQERLLLMRVFKDSFGWEIERGFCRKGRVGLFRAVCKALD